MTEGAAAMLARAAAGDGGAIEASELVELIDAFNEVSARLQETHQTLHREVARLQTELDEARSQLRRARELAALGEMAAGISHEIRNPLGSIRLYAGMLEEDLTDRPAQRDIALKIDGAVARMDAIVNDVLAFSRELHITPTPVSAVDLIEEAVNACRDVIDGAGIDLVLRDEQVELTCDPGLTLQALINVVRNAAEALGEQATPGGRLEIGVVRRDVMDARGRRRPMIGVAVVDDGPGLPDDVVERIFHPFFTTRHTGTGLGLAIVHRILDAHDGRIVIVNLSDNAPRLIARGDDPHSQILRAGECHADPDAAVRGTTAEDAGSTTNPSGRGTRVELLLPDSKAESNQTGETP